MEFNGPILRNSFRGLVSFGVAAAVFGIGFGWSRRKRKSAEQTVTQLPGRLCRDYPTESKAWGGVAVLAYPDVVAELIQTLRRQFGIPKPRNLFVGLCVGSYRFVLTFLEEMSKPHHKQQKKAK